MAIRISVKKSVIRSDLFSIMDLSVIVTNYKTPELLKLCLKSLKEALVQIKAEVFVMDSQSDEDTEFVVNEFFPEFELVPFEKNIGFRALVNEGLPRAQGRYVLILNSDIILTNSAIKKLMDYLDLNKETGMVGPQLLNLDGGIQNSCLRFFGPLTVIARRTFFGKTKKGKELIGRFLMEDFSHNEIREVDWMLGSALLVRTEAIKKIGPMDKRFFMYFEDVDWCRRFWQAGYKVIYFPEAKMYHYHLRVSQKAGGIFDLFVNKYTWIHIISAVKYYWKYRFKNVQLT